jgi:hypothetical protein
MADLHDPYQSGLELLIVALIMRLGTNPTFTVNDLVKAGEKQLVVRNDGHTTKLTLLPK